jgi:hypothetical protein
VKFPIITLSVSVPISCFLEYTNYCIFNCSFLFHSLVSDKFHFQFYIFYCLLTDIFIIDVILPVVNVKNYKTEITNQYSSNILLSERRTKNTLKEHRQLS